MRGTAGAPRLPPRRANASGGPLVWRAVPVCQRSPAELDDMTDSDAHSPRATTHVAGPPFGAPGGGGNHRDPAGVPHGAD